jgi:fatty-acyl-CoA synthase
MHGARDKRYMANYWRYIERFGVTQISGVPTTLSVLIKNPPTHERISSLRPYFATGSTAIAPSIQEQLLKITGARTLQSYGLTENTSHATLDPRDGPIKEGCSGFRVPYVQVKICEMNEQGLIKRECRVGEIGMVLLGGPGVAGGYLDTAHNAGVFLEDGWLVTGDLGSLDEQGYIRISGRQKDLIIRSGHNIEPRIIEEALLQAPEVALAAAVGKPDAHAGELPVAYVQLHPGAKLTQEQLLQVATQHIHERPAVPKEIIVLDQLPLTAVGKPQKHLLQLDAARRTFTDALKAVDAQLQLDLKIVGGGLFLSVNLSAEHMQSKPEIEQILSRYTIRHEVLCL